MAAVENLQYFPRVEGRATCLGIKPGASNFSYYEWCFAWSNVLVKEISFKTDAGNVNSAKTRGQAPSQGISQAGFHDNYLSIVEVGELITDLR